MAVQVGHEEIVKLLLETGQIDINLKDAWNGTALLWAVEKGHENIVKILLEADKMSVTRSMDAA